MLSKEDLLERVQQGTPEPNWTVMRPKPSYFLNQIVTWFILFLLPVGIIIYYLNAPNHALVLAGTSIDTMSALQAWRTIDFVVFSLLAVGFMTMLVGQVLNLLDIKRQLLVLTPQACFIRLRKKEYFVAYANIISIVPNIQRNGNMKLNIQTHRGPTTLDLDSRFGKAKDLTAQIIMAHRQVVTTNKM